MPSRKPAHYISSVEGLLPLHDAAVSIAATAGGATLDALLNSAAGTTALAKAARATISVASACHIVFGGVVAAPTASVGHPLAAASTFVVEGNVQINNAKLISDSGTAAAFVTLEG